MAEVGVHVDGHLETMLATELKALKDCCAEAAPTATHQHVQTWLLLREVQGQPPRAIG